MATLNVGPFFEENNEFGRFVQLYVPDEGILPELRIDESQLDEANTRWGMPYGLGENLYLTILLHSIDYTHHGLYVFFVERRLEWVCFECHSRFDAVSRYDYDHYFHGPYRVSDTVMQIILSLHDIDPADGFVPTPEARRLHPDLLGDFWFYHEG